jgi:hypothetical protein
MSFLRNVLITALSSAALTASPAAAQVVVDGTTYNSGDALTLYFNGMSDKTVISGLKSELNLKFNGWDRSTGDYLFDYALKNSSVGHSASEVTGFGFDTSPDPDLGLSKVTGDFTRFSSGNIANGFKVEFCVTGGPKCNGGSSTGPDVGQTWKGSFILGFSGTSNPGPITFSNFHTRYQSVTTTSARGITSNGGSATGNLTSVTSQFAPRIISPVPEPATWGMMLIGFGAVGASMRRRRANGRVLQPA